MRPIWQMAMGVAATMLLAGCGTPSVVEAWPNPQSNIASIYDYGAGGRDLRLIVRGNPLPMPDDAFNRMIETDVQGPLMRQPTHPTLTPGASAQPNYALIFDFSSSPRPTPDQICQYPGNAPAGQVASGGDVHVVGAFCVSGRAYSGAMGRAGADGAAQVSQLMPQMMMALFRPDLRDNPGGSGGGDQH